MLRSLQTFVPDDEQVQRALDHVREAVDPIVDSLNQGIAVGRFLEVSLTTGQDNRINPKLGRPCRGYLVVRKDADARVWDTDAGRYLVLQCSANVNVTLWVFA